MPETNEGFSLSVLGEEGDKMMHDVDPALLPKDNIHVVTPETLEAETKKYEILILNFYADWK